MIDFNPLDDEQLLSLLTAALDEAMRRGGPIARAAADVMIDGQERARIEAEVAAEVKAKAEAQARERIEEEARAKLQAEERKAAASQTEQIWALKSAFVHALRRWGYPGAFEVSIWSRGADRRVYFQDKAHRFSWKYCLYLVGNQYSPPGKLEAEGKACWFDDKLPQLKALLTTFSKSWKGDVRFDEEAGTIAPREKTVETYLKAIGGIDGQPDS